MKGKRFEMCGGLLYILRGAHEFRRPDKPRIRNRGRERGKSVVVGFESGTWQIARCGI